MDDATPTALQRLTAPRSCTFHPGGWAFLLRCWFPVARGDEVAGKPIQGQLLDADLVV